MKGDNKRKLVYDVTLKLEGQRFGKLTVLHRHLFAFSTKGSYWLCRCDCGNEKVASGTQLVHGMTRSCGCLRGQSLGSKRGRKATHGKSGTPEYRAWYNLMQRKDVCDAWLKFENFLADLGPRPSDKCRLVFTPTEQDKKRLAECYPVKYGPENCKWVEIE